ncbi:MAG: hypothetical protein A4E23_01645 [Methanomethylovorans sp. PtaU1.Bin073]|nr:MAG: hypothetical protein A4E23_01645 [Methanomethylovorans sp. PtaU1.Bin073]
MNQIRDLQAIAGSMYSDKNVRQWIFQHTYTQDQYRQVWQALRTLAEYQPVQWEGQTGDRHAVPLEVKA